MNHLFKSTSVGAFVGALCAASSGTAGAQPAPPIDETNVVVIIDVTGSMSQDAGSLAPGDPVLSRYEVGVDAALNYLINDSATFTNPEFEVWEFSSASGGYARTIASFPSTRNDAIVGVSSSTLTTGATPMAATICDAVERLKNYESGKTIVDPVTGDTRLARIERRIFLASDGLENNTPSHECQGPSSTDTSFPTYDDFSWQWHVYNKLKTGNANTESTAPFDYIIDVEHILTNFITSQDAGSVAAEMEGLGEEYANGQIPYSSVEDDVGLFQGLAAESGGSYHQIAPDSQGVIDPRIPGDANDDGCVDYDDYNIFIQVYGYQVTTSNPMTLQADFDGDGWVDDDDYMRLIQHWAEGC